MKGYFTYIFTFIQESTNAEYLIYVPCWADAVNIFKVYSSNFSEHAIGFKGKYVIMLLYQLLN